MNNNKKYNVAQPNGDNQPATKIWSENKFLDKSSGVMAGSLKMSNNRITNVGILQAGKMVFHEIIVMDDMLKRVEIQ